MTEWIAEGLHEFGYVGIFFMLALARVLPPVPGEAVIPLAGIGAAHGAFNLWLVVLAGGLGSAAGEFVWYLPSRLVGPERFDRFMRRYGHWLAMTPKQVERATAWFKHRGGIAVLMSQPVPGLRTVISVPAGACRQSPLVFLFYSALGSAVWLLALAGFGYLVQHGWPHLANWMVPATFALFGALFVLYVVRMVTLWRRPTAKG